jgi:hypothetical protein
MSVTTHHLLLRGYVKPHTPHGKKKLVCAYCGKRSEGRYSVDVDLDNGDTIDFWICDKCALPEGPTLEEIRERIGTADILIIQMKIARGELSVNDEAVASISRAYDRNPHRRKRNE